MNYRLCVALVALSVLTTSFALQSTGRPGGGRAGVGLLFLGDVQRELKLTSAQKAMLDKAISQSSIEANIVPILNVVQKQRYEQLKLQATGPLSLTRPDIAAKLKFSGSQKKSAAAILLKAKPSPGQITEQNYEKRRAENLAKREAMNKSLLAMLTPTQKLAWVKLQGRAFVFPRIGVRPAGIAR